MEEAADALALADANVASKRGALIWQVRHHRSLGVPIAELARQAGVSTPTIRAWLVEDSSEPLAERQGT